MDKPIRRIHLRLLELSLREQIHRLIIREFVRSGMTQHELATRLGRPKSWVRRVLRKPRNLTIENVSDLLFAISAAELSMTVVPIFDTPAEGRGND